MNLKSLATGILASAALVGAPLSAEAAPFFNGPSFVRAYESNPVAFRHNWVGKKVTLAGRVCGVYDGGSIADSWLELAGPLGCTIWGMPAHDTVAVRNLPANVLVNARKGSCAQIDGFVHMKFPHDYDPAVRAIPSTFHYRSCN